MARGFKVLSVDKGHVFSPYAVAAFVVGEDYSLEEMVNPNGSVILNDGAGWQQVALVVVAWVLLDDGFHGYMF